MPVGDYRNTASSHYETDRYANVFMRVLRGAYFLPSLSGASKHTFRGMRHGKYWWKLKNAATRYVLRPVDTSKCICGPPLGELFAALPHADPRPSYIFVQGNGEEELEGL